MSACRKGGALQLGTEDRLLSHFLACLLARAGEAALAKQLDAEERLEHVHQELEALRVSRALSIT